MIRTQDLSGRALDWAVATAKGLPEEPYVEVDGLYRARWRGPQFSIDWALAGRIIERERIDIRSDLVNGEVQWNAFIGQRAWKMGPSPLVAAMRCFVASKLGEEIDVPDELIGDLRAA